MFYAHFVLAKKGPLARIWLAAHWDKKLTKAHVFETNIESSVEGILQPKVKMALRTSGHLLLGIVRIYSRKAKYLLADCNEAFIKIKMAFRPGVVDLPEANREAAVATITLPEVFHDFDSAMPDITIDMDEQVNLNQSRAEDITLKEDYGNLQNLMADDGFDDMAFDEPEGGRDATSMEEGFETASLLLEEKSKDQSQVNETMENNVSVSSKPNVSLDAPLRDDGFGGTVGEGLLDGETGGLFEPAGLFDDAPLDNVALENPNAEPMEPVVAETITKSADDPHEEDSDDDYDMGPASVGAPSPPTSPESPVQPLTSENIPEPCSDVGDTTIVPPEPHTDMLDMNPPSTSMAPSENANDILSTVPELPPAPAIPAIDQTTLINNEEESFALAPLDTTIMHGAERTVKAKRKRKLIVDEVKNISGEEMKSQLSDTTDIVTTLDLAPPTKRLMHWKETGGVEKLFALPGHQILSSKLSRAYIRHLTTRAVDNEDFGTGDDLRIDLEEEVEQPRERERDEPPEVPSVSRKRARRGTEMDQVYPQDLSHFDTLHLDASRPSYASDHNLSHPSLDVPNFLHQQMMGNVMHPPPPAHMIQQMLQQTDVNQLAHLPDMMHPNMMDPGTPLHSMSSNLHNVPSVPSPVITDSFNQRLMHPVMDQVPEHPHLLSDPVSDQMPHTPMDKQIPGHSPLTNQMNHSLQDPLSQPNALDSLSCIENSLQNDMMTPHIDSHMLPPLQQQPLQLQQEPLQLQQQPLQSQNSCLGEDFSHIQSLEDANNALATTVSNMLPNEHNNLPVVNDHINEANTQNCVLNTEMNQTVDQQQSEANSVFDALSNDFRLSKNLQENNQLQTQDANHVQPNALEANATDKNEFPVSDDDDDYAAPGSVGPVQPEEQMADETYEQFEERILTKRTVHMLHIINSKLEREHRINFAEVARNHKRKQVAQKFYTFLVLKKQQAVELEQSSSYGDLYITKGPKYNTVLNSN